MKGKFRWKLVGLGALGVFALVLIFVFLSFQNYEKSIAESLAGAPISVYIQNPQPGSQFELGALVAVHAQASGPSPVISMELWVDGEMVQVYSAPGPGGLLEFQADYYLQELPLGFHSIFARAVEVNYATETSAILPIEIVEMGGVTPEEAEAAYVDPGLSVPRAIMAQNAGGGAPPYFGQPTDEGGGDPDSPPNFPNPEEPPAPPEPIELVTDLLPIEPWSPSLGDWFQHLFVTVENLPEAPGIPASAVEGCTPRIWISDNSDNEDGFYVYRRDPGLANFLKIATLEAHVGNIFTFEDEEVYGSYQYFVSAFNNDGEAASNIETVEVDSPNCKPDISHIFAFNLAGLFGDQASDMSYCYYTLEGMNWLRFPAAPQSFMDNVDPDFDQLLLNDTGQMTPLSLDCWAWLGGGLTQVGFWQFDDIFADGFEGIQFEALDYEGDSAFTHNLTESFFDDSLVYHILPGDIRVPVPIVSLGAGSQLCADHTPINFILAFVCADVADDLDFAVWDLGECYADLCFKDSDVIGYNVYDTLYDEGSSPVTTIDSPITLYFLVNGTACDPRHVRVTALVEYEGGELLESLPSNQVFYNGNPNCAFLYGLEPRTYRITLDTIQYDTDVEGPGWAFLKTEEHMGRSWNLENEAEFGEGTAVLWQDLNLVRCESQGELCYSSSTSDLGFFHNAGNFPLYIGEWAALEVYFPHCKPSLGFNTYSIDDSPGQVFFGSMSYGDGDASCLVTFHVELIN